MLRPLHASLVLVQAFIVLVMTIGIVDRDVSQFRKETDFHLELAVQNEIKSLIRFS